MFTSEFVRYFTVFDGIFQDFSSIDVAEFRGYLPLLSALSFDSLSTVPKDVFTDVIFGNSKAIHDRPALCMLVKDRVRTYDIPYSLL